MAAYQREDTRDATPNAAGDVERFETDRFLNEPELLAMNRTNRIAASALLICIVLLTCSQSMLGQQTKTYPTIGSIERQ